MPGKPVYQTYTRVSRQAGMTVPALKKLLTSEGYLVGRDATQKAFDCGIAKLRHLTPEQQKSREGYRESFPTWDRDRVLALAKKKKLTKDPRLVAGNKYRCGDNLGHVCSILLDTYGDFDRMISSVPKDALSAAREYNEFETIMTIEALIDIEEGQLRPDHFSIAFAPLVAFLPKSKVSKADQALIVGIIESVDAFAKRIAKRAGIAG